MSVSLGSRACKLENVGEKKSLQQKNMKKIYVGNLSWGTTNESLAAAFKSFGEVSSAIVMMDKMTGRSRGFGFVEMTNDAEADMAISKLHESDLDGRNIIVNEARPREEGAMGAGAPRRTGGFGGPRRF